MRSCLPLTILLFASACASGVAEAPPELGSPTGGTTAPPSTPPPPVPPAPPEATAYIAGPEPVLQPTGDPVLDVYRERLFEEGGPSWRPFLLRALAGVRANPAILAASGAEPKTAVEYVERYVTPSRIAEGRRLYEALRGKTLFPEPQKVPLEVLLAMWGAYSDYGAKPPPFDMIEAIANLEAHGKGPGWGYFEIFHAIRFLAESQIPRAKARAYADGRIGQVRWLPEKYLRFRADGDGDGIADIWTNRADILLNLQRSIPGWEVRAPLMVEVIAPDYQGLDARERQEAATAWARPEFLRRADGRAWPVDRAAYQGRLLSPAGEAGPTYLVTVNFDYMNYQNPFLPRYGSIEEREGFALAIALLADAIAGRPGPTRPIGVRQGLGLR